MIGIVVADGNVVTFEPYRAAFARIGVEIMTRDIFFVPGKSYITSLVEANQRRTRTYVKMTYRHNNEEGEAI